MTKNKNDNEKLVNETVEEMKQKIELISSEADKVEGDSKEKAQELKNKAVDILNKAVAKLQEVLKTIQDPEEIKKATAFVEEKSKQIYDFTMKKIEELKTNEDLKKGLNQAEELIKDVAGKAQVKAKEAYDKALENEDIKKAVDKAGAAIDDAKKNIEEFIKKPETQEAIEKAKDTTIDIAEKAVAALKDWLKPEDK